MRQLDAHISPDPDDERPAPSPVFSSTDSAFRANSATAGPIESITLRDIRHGSDLAADGHSLTARRTHTASDVFVILKAGRSARGSPSPKSVAVR
jgi:hypothetical protein